jgi:pyruvate dehydrogenase E2 component (dihydrolipoamide acetyltransferase)
MPKMSMTMTEGVFLTWHKSPGDEVREGEVVCEVATDKVDMEVEATVAGTLTRLLASPEDVVPVGEPIAYVAAESDELLEGLFDAPDPPADQTPPPAPPPETRAESAAAGHRQVVGGEAEPSVAPPVHGRAESGSPAASATLPGSASQPDSAAAGPRVVAAVPAARRLATERGVDLATITPTGPWDTIRLSDVDTGRRAGNGRTAIARRMAASAQIPQFVLYRDLDLETVDRTHGWTVLLTHAFATALRRHPALNASWADGVTHHEHVGVALAVDTDRGLLAPVLTDPDLDTLDTLGTRLADVVGRARTGRLGLAELTAPATTTVSNLGGLGVTGFHAVLTPPQATALAVGAIEPKVVPVPGGVGVRLRCTVGLTVDHRVADGAEAARLLGTLQELL